VIALSVVLLAGCKGKTIDIGSNTPAIAATVHAEVDLDAGVDGGTLDQPLSTAFAAAVWQYQFFSNHPEELDPDTSALVALGPRHVLVQLYDSPLRGKDDWDFTELDAIVGRLLRLGFDPLIQIASAPQSPVAHPDAFADYCAKIVSYYNADGGLVLDDGGTLKSDAGHVTWWGIWSDPNTDNGDFGPDGGAVYASVYRSAVAAMRAVDPSLKFSATEFNDCIDLPALGRSFGCSRDFVADFLAAAAIDDADAGPMPIDALSVHMYSTDLAIAPPDKDSGLAPYLYSDSQVFQTGDMFADDMAIIRRYLVAAGRPDTPVWVTENQVNSDTPTDMGFSAHGVTICNSCSPMPAFRADERGTDAFFAAWRPLMFSKLGKAGNRELYQWQYTAGSCPDANAGCSVLSASDTDRQNAEVDYITGQKYLSYWVDRALVKAFQLGGRILKVDVTPADALDADVELLAVERTEGTRQVVVVMIVNRAVRDPAVDLDGPGVRRNVVLNLQPLMPSDAGGVGAWSVTESILDKNTDLDAGPNENSVTLQSDGWLPVTLDGYGVAFVTLTRATGG
jgi:hypothetical protein